MKPASSPLSSGGGTLTLPQIAVYSLGECAVSLVMNGIFGFAMLFYTKSLGLNPTLAGLAMSISVFWEAVSEPVMGHVSDRTRSRWGRRHPYMLVGGLLMTVCSYLIWTVPPGLRESQMAIFWYLLTVNLILRTGLTLFFIPYVALGFEMCTDYEGRSRLQGIRQIFNMAANFAGPAMAWSIFFRDQGGVQATTIASNYRHMGGSFAVATLAFVLGAVLFTFRWHEDTRRLTREAQTGWLRGFYHDMREILLDPNPRSVFAFIFVVCAGMVIVSSLQMFVYDDFMKFPAWQKSIAHGGTMVGVAFGAFLAIGLARRFDKRGAVLIGGAVSIACNVILALILLTGWLSPEATLAVGSVSVPIALIVFVIFHAGYWLGSGIMLPTSVAMMADVSEVCRLKTGVNKDGGYTSVFSLAMRMAISFSLIVSGWCLHLIGYLVPKDGRPVVQTPEAIWRLGLVTFVIGALLCLASLLAIRAYPITRTSLAQLRADRNPPGRPDDLRPSPSPSG